MVVNSRHWSVLLKRRMLRHGDVFQWQCRRCGSVAPAWHDSALMAIRAGNRHAKTCTKA